MIWALCDDVQLCNWCVRELLILARTWFAFGLPSKTGCDIQLRRLQRPLYKGQISFSRRTHTNSNQLVFFFSSLYATASVVYRPFVHRATDQGRAVSPNQHRWYDILHGCQRIRFLGSASRTSTRVPHHHSSPSLVEITVNKSVFSFYCDDSLIVRSVVDSSFMC
jgi:hypothetical protein